MIMEGLDTIFCPGIAGCLGVLSVNMNCCLGFEIFWGSSSISNHAKF